MSVAEVEICPARNVVGTGDCEVEKPCEKIKPSVESAIIVSEILSEVVENALNKVLATAPKKNSVGDIFNKPLKIISKHFVHKKEKLAEEKVASSGVGDQLPKKDVIPKEDVILPPVEKKNRLTDLVKNSKQVLAKFLIEDKERAEFEVKNEKVVEVINLEDNEVNRSFLSDELPFAEEGEESDDPTDFVEMKTVHLCDVGKRMTFPICAAPSAANKNKGFLAKCATLRGTIPRRTVPRTLMPPTVPKENKWNFGTRIADYLRKHRLSKHGLKLKKPAKKGELVAEKKMGKFGEEKKFELVEMVELKPRETKKTVLIEILEEEPELAKVVEPVELKSEEAKEVEVIEVKEGKLEEAKEVEFIEVKEKKLEEVKEVELIDVEEGKLEEAKEVELVEVWEEKPEAKEVELVEVMEEKAEVVEEVKPDAGKKKRPDDYTVPFDVNAAMHFL